MLSYLIMAVKVSLILWGAVTFYAKLLKPEDAVWVRGKPLAIMIIFYCVGMLGHNVWVLYLVMMAILPMMAKSRAEGAALFIIALGAVPDLNTGLWIGGAAIVSMDKVLCLALGFLIVFLKEPRAGVPYRGWFDLPFLILMALELVQARGFNFTSTIRSLLSTFLTIGLPYYLLTRSIGRPEDLRRMLVAFGFLGFVLAVVAVFESRTHFLVYQQIYSALNVQGAGYRMFKMRGGLLRALTSFGDATSFSIFLAGALMATIACRSSFKTTSRLVIALGVICLGIFVTSSRNAWLTMVIAILMFDLYRRRYVALAGKMTVMAMAYAVLSLIAQFSPYVNSMVGNDADTSSTSDYRSQLLTRGIEEFQKHPFLGQDIGTAIKNMPDMIQGEGIVDIVNGYLYYALTGGYAGLVGLVLGLFLPAWAMLRARRNLMRHGPEIMRYAAFMFSITLAQMVTTAFTAFGGYGSIFFYLMMSVGAVLYAWQRLQPEMLVSTRAPRRPVLAPGWAAPIRPVPAPLMPEPIHA